MVLLGGLPAAGLGGGGDLLEHALRLAVHLALGPLLEPRHDRPAFGLLLGLRHAALRHRADPLAQPLPRQRRQCVARLVALHEPSDQLPRGAAAGIQRLEPAVVLLRGLGAGVARRCLDGQGQALEHLSVERLALQLAVALGQRLRPLALAPRRRLVRRRRRRLLRFGRWGGGLSAPPTRGCGRSGGPPRLG